MVIRLYAAAFLLLAACQSASPAEKLHERSRKLCEEFAEELRDIRTVEDLKRSLPKMRKTWMEFAELILEARAFCEEHPDAGGFGATEESGLLFAELQRLLEIPRAQELISASQHEAVLRLIPPARPQRRGTETGS